MTTHVLDTSAILAHYLREPGADTVHSILARGPEAAGISLITVVELRSRLPELAANPQEADRAFKLYTATLMTVLPFSRQTAEAAKKKGSKRGQFSQSTIECPVSRRSSQPKRAGLGLPVTRMHRRHPAHGSVSSVPDRVEVFASKYDT